MPDLMHASDQPSLASLVGGIIEDVQRLLRQEVALARQEIKAEWDKTKTGAALLVGGVIILGLGGILLAFMLVKLLELVLPNHEWACYAIVGGGFALLGAALVYSALNMISSVHIVPPRTAQTIEDNIEAVANVVTTDNNAGGPPRR